MIHQSQGLDGEGGRDVSIPDREEIVAVLLPAAADRPVALEETQLAQGLIPEELAVLKLHLVETRLEAGDVLFRRGAAGSSIYVIQSGRIDIRIDTDQASGGWRRMAALGPGCMIGEVAMLTGGLRSADAVCVRPAHLFELR